MLSLSALFVNGVRRLLVPVLLCLSLGGCAVVSAVDVAASAVVGVAGLAVDAAVGTVRIGGKIVGAGADAVLDSDDEDTGEDE